MSPIASDRILNLYYFGTGIFVVVSGIGCMALMAVRKNHLRQMYDQSTGQFVHYIRTPTANKKEEDEMAIITHEYNQFYNMNEM